MRWRKPGSMPPWLAKALRWCLRLAYAGLVVVVCGVAAYAAFSLFVRSGVTAVPDLRGLTETEAERLMTDQGLALERLEGAEAYDDEIEAGAILRQDPPARTLVKRGAEVAVAFSLGPQVIAVPDLSGQSAQAAQLTLATAGLAMGRTLSVLGERAEPGSVVGQKPTPGETAAPGEAVDLLVSRADPGGLYLMPDLVYRDAAEVKRFFELRGFRLGSVKYEVYEGVREGVILRQFPLAGHLLRRRDAISLVVATAAETLPRGEP